MLSRLEYDCQLWSPFLIWHITPLEKTQRYFTKHITVMHDIYSLSDIYILKIVEGLAPNFSNTITSRFSERRGISCGFSHVNAGRLSTLAYNSSGGAQSIQ